MANQNKYPWGYAKPASFFGHTWQTYRLTGELWQRLWDEQKGLCAGCQGEFAHPLIKKMPLQLGLRPEVDHCHSLDVEHPEYVRGLLCRKCNDLLGKLRDNKETLQNLVDYLARHGEKLDDIR